MNTAEAVAALLETAEKNGIVINRMTETYGMFRHTARRSRNTASCATITVWNC